jgi:hypothetical protein
MSVALRGNLQDFGIAEVFQLIGQQGKTGLLEIEVESQRVRLAFDGGRVVWASPLGTREHSELGARVVRCGLLTPERLTALFRDCEASARVLPVLLVESGAVAAADLEQIRDLLTQDTIFQVLGWKTGSFHFSAQAVKHNLAPERMLGAEQILMDGLRMVDEWQTFAGVLPDDKVVFRSAGSFEEYRHQATAVGQHRIALAERVFRLIDGRVSARRVIDLARLTHFDGTRVLSDLFGAGLIEPVHPIRSRLRRASGAVEVGAHVRWWLGAVIPLMVLAGVVSLGVARPTWQPPPAGLVIPGSPYQRIHDLFETRRLLHAIEAQRYITGQWPRDLAERDETGKLGRPMLAPDSGRPYYYAVREGGVLLLAPER